MQYKKSLRREILARDRGCVFCATGYRSSEHVPIPDYGVYTFRGKRVAICRYHAQFLDPAHFAYYTSRSQEMFKILECYLADKEDPEIF